MSDKLFALDHGAAISGEIANGKYRDDAAARAAESFNKAFGYKCASDTVDTEQIKRIVEYANAKRMSVRQLLTAAGFDCSNIKAHANIITDRAYCTKNGGMTYEYRKAYYKGIDIDEYYRAEAKDIQILDCGYNAIDSIWDWITGGDSSSWNFVKSGSALRFEMI